MATATLQSFNVFLTEKLTAAALDIYGFVEKTITDYQEEVYRARLENERLQRLLDLVYKPDIRLRRADTRQIHLPPPTQEVCAQDQQIKSERPVAPVPREDKEERDRPVATVPREDKEERECPVAPVPREDKEELIIHRRFCARGQQIKRERPVARVPRKDKEEREHPVATVQREDKEELIIVPLKTEQTEAWSSSVATPVHPEAWSSSVETPVLPEAWSSSAETPVHPDNSWVMDLEHDEDEIDEYEALNYSVTVGEEPLLHDQQSPSHEGSPTAQAAEPLPEPINGSFSCFICGKTTDTRSEMIRHHRSHTDYKPYTCSICGNSFKLKGHLTEHWRTHSGQRPYGCYICGQRFGRSSNMSKHMRNKHKESMAFKCMLCDNRFSLLVKLKAHLKLVHNVVFSA